MLGVVDRGRVLVVLIERLGWLDPMLVVDVLAVELDRRLAVERHAVELALHRGRRPPGRDHVLDVEPPGVRERGVVQEAVERIDPLVRDVERVVHRVGRRGREVGGLGREVEDRLLTQIARVNLLQLDVDAGQLLEGRHQCLEVVEVAGRDHRDDQTLAVGLAPVDVGLLIGREVLALGPRRSDPGRREGGTAKKRAGPDNRAPRQTAGRFAGPGTEMVHLFASLAWT